MVGDKDRFTSFVVAMNIFLTVLIGVAFGCGLLLFNEVGWTQNQIIDLQEEFKEFTKERRQEYYGKWF